MMIIVAMQNLVAYSVNMADNIMLGSYNQNALSGAATVNQIFFMVQQVALSVGNALVVLASQYWGQKKIQPIRSLTGIALKLGAIFSLIILALCICIPTPLLKLFTSSPDILAEGLKYLSIVQWTFALFIITNILMSALRSVGTVNISFYISVVSLLLNVCINYCFIFGRFGFPEMGIKGAAIGTLAARIVELLIVVIYLLKFDQKINLFTGRLSSKYSSGTTQSEIEIQNTDKELKRDYTKVYIPIFCSQVLWGISVPMQTAILGHLSDDAIAANSVATTFYQYLKVIVLAMSSTSAVMIGNAIGRGNIERVKSDARTMAVLDVCIGVLLGVTLLALRGPLLSMYHLTDSATVMAEHLIMIMSLIMVGMSYQMPVSFGIIQGAGDGKFTMRMNMISTWMIVMPLSFAAAFWWKLPVELVVLIIQSDQIFKGLPTFIHFRKYGWIKKLTK